MNKDQSHFDYIAKKYLFFLASPFDTLNIESGQKNDIINAVETIFYGSKWPKKQRVSSGCVGEERGPSPAKPTPGTN